MKSECFNQIFKSVIGLMVVYSSNVLGVKVSEVTLDKLETYKVETEMGTFHWESADGRSGWMSAFDLDGKDWIQAGPSGRGVGSQSANRGLPNAGLFVDDWGHPSKTSTYNKKGTTSEIIGDKEGPSIIIESKNTKIKGRWHCFETHIALEVLEMSTQHHFLYEGTPGGKVHSPGLVTADGKEITIKTGWFNEEHDWPAGDVGEWFYIKDPNNKYHFWMGQTPATNDPGELWHQDGNMDLVSFGRRDPKKVGGDKNAILFKDTSRKWAFGFVPASLDFASIKKHIETVLENPLKPKAGGTKIISTKGNSMQMLQPDISIKNRSINITFSEKVGDISFNLLDATGRIVDKWIHSDKAGTPTHTLQDLRGGVYFLKGSTKTGKQILSKFAF